MNRGGWILKAEEADTRRYRKLQHEAAETQSAFGQLVRKLVADSLAPGDDSEQETPQFIVVRSLKDWDALHGLWTWPKDKRRLENEIQNTRRTAHLFRM